MKVQDEKLSNSGKAKDLKSMPIPSQAWMNLEGVETEREQPKGHSSMVKRQSTSQLLSKDSWEGRERSLVQVQCAAPFKFNKGNWIKNNFLKI